MGIKIFIKVKNNRKRIIKKFFCQSAYYEKVTFKK